MRAPLEWGRAKWRWAALLPLGSALVPACSDGSIFTTGRDPQVCVDSIPSACGAMARCVLDTDHYLEGRFPGAQRFVIHTGGDANLHFDIQLNDRLAAGTSLRLQVSEPSCIEKSLYDSAGRDIFQDTGPDGMLTIPVHVRQPGDHLVEVSADAYCSYQLRFE